MFFYVYLDPAVISVAKEAGELGLPLLTAILRSFLHNCFIADFNDFRIQIEIKERINDLPEDFDRTTIKKIMGALVKRNRFIACLTPDDLGERPELDLIKEQAISAQLDLLLLSSLDGTAELGNTEYASLTTYQNTNFENERSSFASEGITLSEGKFEAQAFLDRFLGKGLKYAGSIQIWDKLFGKKYANNYKFTAETLLRWLEHVLAEPEQCKLVFHCAVPDDQALSQKKWKTASRPANKVAWHV